MHWLAPTVEEEANPSRTILTVFVDESFIGGNNISADKTTDKKGKKAVSADKTADKKGKKAVSADKTANKKGKKPSPPIKPPIRRIIRNGFSLIYRNTNRQKSLIWRLNCR